MLFNLGSKLGKVWLVLNPLFLAVIYFLLVTIIQGGRGQGGGFTTLCHILIGLFTFYFAQNCILLGAQSITSGGSLILNQAFPRSLLPLSSAISAAKQFFPNITVEDLREPYYNAIVAATYLKYQISRFKGKGISAFNAGRPIKGNKNYVAKVNKNLEVFNVYNKRNCLIY